MRRLSGHLLVCAFLMLANGISTPVVSARLSAQGVDAMGVGVILGLGGVGFAIAAFFGGGLVARLGERFALSLAPLGLALGLSIMASFDPPVWVASGRMVCGASVAFACLAMETGLGQAAGARRGLVLGLYLVTSNVALAVAPAFAELGAQGLWVAAAAAAGAALPAQLLGVGEVRTPVGSTRLDIPLVIRRAPGAAVAAFAGGTVAGSLLAMAPLQAQLLGIAPGPARVYLAGLVLMGAVVPLILGLLADRLDRDRVILAAALVLTGAALGGAFFPAWGSVAGLIVASGFGFALYPLGLGLAQERLTAAEMPRAAGVFLLAYAVGSTIGPIGAGALMGASGPHALALWVALAGSLSVLGPALRTASGGLAGARWARWRAGVHRAGAAVYRPRP